MLPRPSTSSPHAEPTLVCAVLYRCICIPMFQSSTRALLTYNKLMQKQQDSEEATSLPKSIPQTTEQLAPVLFCSPARSRWHAAPISWQPCPRQGAFKGAPPWHAGFTCMDGHVRHSKLTPTLESNPPASCLTQHVSTTPAEQPCTTGLHAINQQWHEGLT